MSTVHAPILIVDDRPENLLALEAILEPLGHELVRANSGEEALKQLLRREFAVILLDVQMPGLDGFETATLIKDRERTSHVPIIFLTAISKDAEHVFRGYDTGAVDYLFKPFNGAILRSKVRTFIELHDKREEVRVQAEQLAVREVEQVRRESEDRYRFLAESIPQQVWTATTTGELDYVNQEVLVYFGRTFEEMIGWSWSELVHPDDLPGAIARWSRSLEQGEDYEVDFRLRRAADGAYRWHLGRARAMRNEAGEITSWFGTNTDVDDASRQSAAHAFLAEAGAILGDSLEIERTLAAVARLAVPRVADWCAIDIVRDGAVERVAVAHVDERKVKLAHDVHARYPVRPDDTHGVGAVIASGLPQLVPAIDDDALATLALDERQRDLVTELGLRSYICVPLLQRDEVLGAITLVQAESGLTYGEADLAVMQELARRAAIAVDNARLYRAAEERAQAARALAAIGDGVFMLDREGQIRLWNPAAEAITGIPEVEAVGHHAENVLPGWDDLAARVPVGASGEPARPESIPLEVGGRELWLSISGVELDDGAVYAFRDLTEERALEEIKAEFVATVSHELRTPLAAIYGSAQTIRRPDLELDDELRDELLGVISTESDRLATIVNDLLLASHLDSGRLPVTIERCNAVELAQGVVESARTHLPDSIDLGVVTEKRVPPVAADAGQLRQVLANLVDNAIKYSPDGGEVRVRVETSEQKVRFVVADHGLGIPAAERRRVFEKFYRLDPNMNRGIGGTGLGLYICKELVRRVNGRIWVDDTPGGGSTFVVELPAAKAVRKPRPETVGSSRTKRA